MSLEENGAAYKYHLNLKVRRVLSLKGELERAMKDNCYLMAKQKPSGTTLTLFFSSYSREWCFLRLLHLQG